ncbi:unnamed protein product, partial [marine sediment metagenome]
SGFGIDTTTKLGKEGNHTSPKAKANNKVRGNFRMASPPKNKKYCG